MLVRLGTLIVLLLTLATVPARAADPTVLTLATTQGYAGAQAPLYVVLTASDGTPLAGASVVVERRQDGAWVPVTTVVTDADGKVRATAARAKSRWDNTFRATYAGDATHDAASASAKAPLIRRMGVVKVGGDRSVVDERSVRINVSSYSSTSVPVVGLVYVDRSVSHGAWQRYRTLRTDSRGRATFVTRPRADSRWRATTWSQDWVAGDKSPVHAIDNRPPGVPVTLPSAAPKPTVKVPAQPRATTPGADPVVTGIPDSVWTSMVGRSWRSGCPVGRSGLRLLRINYWGYDGYRYRGELVAATSAIDNMSRALKGMYDGGYPLRSLIRVDYFGYSSRLKGGDDYRSMAAGNTSAFNCRGVVGNPGVRSPHATGRALDINTWENPYRSAQGTVPNTWWPSRSDKRVAWRTRSHPVVQIVLKAGFSWTYGTSDSQHFDATSGGSGRRLVVDAPMCGGYPCD
ncbi:M15 family metallopeptidase [Nocardioides plantarum]|uniref:M15 family metallopeptidase n=1 Tax=Nocardioides plantarum TaxID=29299 RepID=A0ABV5K9F1_9ACTN|nr:M15 family metallopeptidase [Nocardioides plantarum]